jgi:phage-related protein
MVKKIYLNNLELSPLTGYYVSKIDNVGFATKYGKGEVYKRHGSVLSEPYLVNRLLNIELTIIGGNQNDLINKKNNLAKNIKVDGKTKLVKIELLLANNELVNVYGVLKSFEENLEAGYINSQGIRMSFETESPFFKSSQLYQVNIPITKGGGGAVPMTIPFNMTAGNSGFSLVSTDGNAISYPEIYFYGVLANPVLINLTTGQTLSLNSLTIGSGNYVKIDTENEIVIDNLGVNKRDKMNGDFIYLLTGENQFKLQSDNPGDTGYVVMIYRNFYKVL